MAKTPAKFKKPEPRACGDIRYRVVRGPREADGRWYWRAERYFSGGGETVWTGWGTVGEADQQVAQIGAGQSRSRPGELTTVADLISCWLATQEDRAEAGDLSPQSLKIRINQCKALKAGIGAVRLDRLDRGTLEGYRNQRIRTVASRMAAYELRALHAAWRWAREEGHIDTRDLARVSVKIVARRDTPAPSPDTVRAVVAQLDGWARLAVLLLEGTGCRSGEIGSLTWDRVDLRAREIRVHGKTGARTVPLLPSLVDELSKWPRTGDKVFPILFRNIGERIRFACKVAGVPLFTPQGLRRAAVGALYRSGADVGTSGKILGHSPAVALRHYYEATPEDRRAAMEAAGLGQVERADVPPRSFRSRRVIRRIRFRR